MRNSTWSNIISNIYNRESFLWNKKISIFLICLLVSFIFWLLIILSNNYTTITHFKAKYVNLPGDKVLVNKLPENYLVELNANGFFLLSLKWNKKEDTIYVRTENFKPLYTTANENDFYILPNSQLKELSSKLGSNARIIKVYPDTVFFYFDKKNSKILPVRLNANLSFEKQHELSGKIDLTPAEIIVKGPESILNKIDALYTEMQHFEKLNKEQRFFAPLALNSELQNLEFSTKKIMVSIPVEKFTEASIDVPIQIVNSKTNLVVKTFPEKVKITYLVALSKYNKINAEQFKVEAVFEDENPNQKLKLKLAATPDYIQHPKMEFQKVEYIVIKK